MGLLGNWWGVVLEGIVGVIVKGVQEIREVVMNEVGEPLSVGYGVGGVAGSTHFHSAANVFDHGDGISESH